MTELDRDQLLGVSGGGKPFDPALSDGCTGAPDGWWRDACVKHDRDLHGPITWKQRKAADVTFYNNLLRDGAPRAVAGLYYYGVRANAVLQRWGVIPERAD